MKPVFIPNKTSHTALIFIRDDQIATSSKLLDIMHESHGLSADLVQTVN